MLHSKDKALTNADGLWMRLWKCESGQTASLWLMMMVMASSVFMGMAWDMSNAWVHKQWTTIAAQAACSAGAMDLEYAANNNMTSTPVASYNFLPSTKGTTNSGDCASNSNTPMCYYAKLNGYTSGGLVANTVSNDVTWATSATAPGNTASSSLTYTSSTNNEPAYLNVTVAENVPVTFFGVFSNLLGISKSWKTVQVGATCNCGLVATSGGMTTTTNSMPDVRGSVGCGAGPWSGQQCTQWGAVVTQAVPANTTLTLSFVGTQNSSCPFDAGPCGYQDLYASTDGGNTWFYIWDWGLSDQAAWPGEEISYQDPEPVGVTLNSSALGTIKLKIFSVCTSNYDDNYGQQSCNAQLDVGSATYSYQTGGGTKYAVTAFATN